MDQPTSVTYSTARGYSDWLALTPTVQGQMLIRAADFIEANYNLKTPLSTDEQVKYDAAQFMVARDIATNATQLSVRSQGIITKEEVELPGLKTLTEYSEGVSDPYPGVTALLEPLRASQGTSSVYVGKLIR